MKLGKKETMISVFAGATIYGAPALGHKSIPPYELYGYHDAEEWINFGFSLPVLVANLFVCAVERIRNKELSYWPKVLVGLGTVAAWKAMQLYFGSLYGHEWIETEIPGNYQSVLQSINSETARGLARALILTPFTRKGYEILREKISNKLNS